MPFKETNDLIYEGIATDNVSTYFLFIVSQFETNDLIYEGIATIQTELAVFLIYFGETNDLIYEGIATHNPLTIFNYQRA